MSEHGRDGCWWVRWWDSHPKTFEYVEPVMESGALTFRNVRYRRPSPEALAAMRRECEAKATHNAEGARGER